jgi:short-subunit dehydrogenase
MQAVLPLMRARGRGAIVNVSSNTTRMVIPGIGAYSSTKSALNQLSATARAEWAADGIAVSIVYPSITATEFHQSLRAGSMRGGAHIQKHPPELVAEAIRRAIATGDAEVFPVPPEADS